MRSKINTTQFLRQTAANLTHTGLALCFFAHLAADPDGKKSSNCPSGMLRPDGRWAALAEPKGEQFFAHTIELEQLH